MDKENKQIGWCNYCNDIIYEKDSYVCREGQLLHEECNKILKNEKLLEDDE